MIKLQKQRIYFNNYIPCKISRTSSDLEMIYFSINLIFGDVIFYSSILNILSVSSINFIYGKSHNDNSQY